MYVFYVSLRSCELNASYTLIRACMLTKDEVLLIWGHNQFI